MMNYIFEKLSVVNSVQNLKSSSCERLLLPSEGLYKCGGVKVNIKRVPVYKIHYDNCINCLLIFMID